MTDFTRRTLLGGAALAAAATALPRGAEAAAPATGKQSAAFYRYKIGSFELTAVHDGVWMRKVDNNFIKGAPRPEIEKAMANAFMAPGIVPTPFTPVVVNTGAKLVMIDTGTGGQMPAPAGGYMANLAAAGIDPKSVDTILISHFHPDHINGIRDKDGGLVFPNAEIQVPAPEWAFWMDDANMGKAPEAARPVWLNVRRIFKDIADKVVKFEPGKEVAPGITSIATPGHTPGHTSYRVTSGNQSMLVLGDVVNNPYLFLRNPDWQGVFDADGAKAVETRKKVLEQLVVDRMLVQGYHFPFPASGYVIQTGAHTFDLTPVLWQPSI